MPLFLIISFSPPPLLPPIPATSSFFFKSNKNDFKDNPRIFSHSLFTKCPVSSRELSSFLHGGLQSFLYKSWSQSRFYAGYLFFCQIQLQDECICLFSYHILMSLSLFSLHACKQMDALWPLYVHKLSLVWTITAQDNLTTPDTEMYHH